MRTTAAATETSAILRWELTDHRLTLPKVATPPDTGETFGVDCPHCGNSFEAELLGESERNLGFKCPHCRLFVAYQPAEEQDRLEPSG
jgi:hypothetical protein